MQLRVSICASSILLCAAGTSFSQTNKTGAEKPRIVKPGRAPDMAERTDKEPSRQIPARLQEYTNEDMGISAWMPETVVQGVGK